MTKKELIKLIKQYDETIDEMDESGYPTGIFTCPLCDRGPIWIKEKKKFIFVHDPNCLRGKFEKFIQRKNL